jgi:hypothetical protein
MFLVPKGIPIREDLAAASVDPPKMFAELKASSTTGFMQLIRDDDATAVLLFNQGRLLNAMVERDGQRVSGHEAVTQILELIAEEQGRVDIYKLTQDLAISVRALLLGEMVFKGQDLSIVDVKVLLDKVKEMQLTGCLRVYTDERTALILYKQGSPLGFFHDGTDKIESSPTGCQNIAGMPGAKLDAYSVDSGLNSENLDLLLGLDVAQLWATAKAERVRRQSRQAKESRGSSEQAEELLWTALEQSLIEISVSHLGKMGAQIIEKELERCGGTRALSDPGCMARLLDGVEKGSKLLAGASKVRQLREALAAEITCCFGAPGAGTIA